MKKTVIFLVEIIISINLNQILVFNTWVRYDQNLNLILIHKQASIFFTPVKDRRFKKTALSVYLDQMSTFYADLSRRNSIYMYVQIICNGFSFCDMYKVWQ